MARYKFRVNDTEYITVDAPYLKEALEQAGIKEDESYEIVEGDISMDRSIKSAITDEPA
ncbi:MAG TPA: hypothetical protein VMT62_00075 [Syntrophorhabdaceae bacterium]|nr:hypothetical protein [Syntrophorhabdaceae bacterium]